MNRSKPRAGATVQRNAAGIGRLVPELVHLAGRDREDVAGLGVDLVAADLHREPAREHLERLRLDRMHVGHRHAAAGSDDDLDQGVGTAGFGGGFDERDRLAGDLVRERVSCMNHFGNLLRVPVGISGAE